MRNSIFVVLAIVSLPATQALATHPLPNETITVILNGHNEVGPDGRLGAGDPDGTAVATLENDHGMLVWSLNYENISGENITGLHIHGPGATPTTNRDIFISFPLLIDFPPPGIPLPNGTIFGVVSSADDPGLPTKMA
ncbi:MAG TPA: CHRD domain-containing protein, partial [Lacipirellulaceae bacterium]